MKSVLFFDTNTIKPNTLTDKNISCPFCNWGTIIEDGLMIEDRGDFSWVMNKFPTIEDAYMTLILETRRCGENFSTYSIEYTKKLFRFIFECMEKLKQTNQFKEILFFKNHGLLSGASISHSHSQIVGFINQIYDRKKIADSVTGPVVYKDAETKITVSEIPFGEFYEFNILWKEGSESFVEWVQTLVKYLDVFKNGQFKNYNLIYHELDGWKLLKLIPRRIVSAYFLGYGIKMIPTDITKIAQEIKLFHSKYHA